MKSVTTLSVSKTWVQLVVVVDNDEAEIGGGAIGLLEQVEGVNTLQVVHDTYRRRSVYS